ncbi:hypothetical protein [Tardiphaga sp.]|uniref:hypothetical protein n=1 Tax=Tardiphaga sp. TaxID=1926292 RepID=UPI00260E42AD|nr:hypothetical protein [Tardiphaga sp.]MDB5616178.1 hypothetical protein [Tardiphaga sp.]
MSEHEEDGGEVSIVIDGIAYIAPYDIADGYVYLHYQDWKKAPVKMLPNGHEATARWALG